MHWFAAGVLAALLAKWLVQIWLEKINSAHVRAHAGEVPLELTGVVDPGTYAKSIEYTLAKSRIRSLELTWNTGLFSVVIFSGLLPWVFAKFSGNLGIDPWASATFLFLTVAVLAIPGLPWEWYHQFHLEARFGFNTTTPRLWVLDRIKGLVLSALLGWPLLWVILKLVQWTEERWWLWGWGVMQAFQWLMALLAPVLILPWFNKFTPLPKGDLRDRLSGLADRTRFHARSIQVMDGSKRSRHSNAFFTGFGRFRKIVLFDTLVQQLEPAELEAVLAHEIGHYKRNHIPKMLVISALSSLAGFCALAWLTRQAWFYAAFGFPAEVNLTPALLLFGLLSGLGSFWFSPLANWWSRRNEYEADAYASAVMAGPRPLMAALRKLNQKNLSNLTPHPAYSRFYYSHPALREREAALVRSSAAT